MNSEEILDLYEWAPGTCFHCARRQVDTTVVGLLHPASSPPQQVRACRGCLLVLESERLLAATRSGTLYEPGRVRPAKADPHDSDRSEDLTGT